MFSSFSIPLSWLRPSAPTFTRRAINIAPVPTHDVEVAAEKRARTLKHYIKANHTNHSIIYHHLQFHNHAPHILGSAYILGASHEQLTRIYDSESAELEPWVDSPGEISKADWRDFLGKRNYQRAFIDFFEDQLVAFGYDWKKLLEHFLYDGEEPLINSLVSGLAHPLIHLGYAHELCSGTIAVESLGLAGCFYNDLHKYIDDPSYTRPGSFKTTSTLDIINKVAADDRLHDQSRRQGAETIEAIPQSHEHILLDYWNSWDISENPLAAFEESQRTSTAIVVATHKPRTKYDFFLLHTLTSSHAVRQLLPIVPARFQTSLVRQWWLFTLMSYIGQGRPAVKLRTIEDEPTDGVSWDDAVHLALYSEHAQDAHYVKGVYCSIGGRAGQASRLITGVGIRAMKNAAETWGDDDQFFLKAASKFSRNFSGWGGFA